MPSVDDQTLCAHLIHVIEIIYELFEINIRGWVKGDFCSISVVDIFESCSVIWQAARESCGMSILGHGNMSSFDISEENVLTRSPRCWSRHGSCITGGCR